MGGFWNENKNTILLICIVAIGVWYVFGGGNNGNNVDQRLSNLENQLSDVAAKQHETTTAIESAESTTKGLADTASTIKSGLSAASATTDRITESSDQIGVGISNATSTVNSCQELLDSSRAELAKCESVFEKVERGNQSGKK